MSIYKNLGESTADVLSHFCNKSIKSENLLSDYLLGIIAKQIAESYKLIDSSRIPSSQEKFSVLVERFDCNQYSRKGLCPLLDIYKIVNGEASGLFSGFYLHGSMATMDYIKGWSDVDILAVVAKETLGDYNKIMQLRSVVMQINEIVLKLCKFQHHGLMLIPENDFCNYTGDILPFEVFSYMKSMKQGKTVLEGMLSNDVEKKSKKFMKVIDFILKVNEESIMRSHAYNDEYLLPEYRNAENGMYQFKYYIEQFMLLPSLYLSSKGEDCYKKYSFDNVREVFPSEVIEWIDLVSKVRMEWGYKPYDYDSNCIPAWVMRIVPRNYFQIGADVAESIRTRFYK